MPKIDRSTMEAALMGYEAEAEKIRGRIAEIQKALGGRTAGRKATGGGGGDIPSPSRRRRRMSATARKRIAEAQRKRWAAYRKGKA